MMLMAVAEFHNNQEGQLFNGQNSGEEAYLSFYNSTNRSISIYWLSPAGNEELYAFLRAGKDVKINSYVNHSWLFRVEKTGELMNVMNKTVYTAQSCRLRDPRNPNQWYPVRKRLAIHVPKRTLRELCLWKYAEYMHFMYVNKYTILKDLLIPLTLKNDLEKILRFMDDYNKREFFTRIR